MEGIGKEISKYRRAQDYTCHYLPYYSGLSDVFKKIAEQPHHNQYGNHLNQQNAQRVMQVILHKLTEHFEGGGLYSRIYRCIMCKPATFFDGKINKSSEDDQHEDVNGIVLSGFGHIIVAL